LEYALIDRTGKHSLSELRTLQDWQVQYQIRAVPGVAEVASVGGFVKQYQVTIDPNKLQAHKISINQVVDQIRRSNQEVGGRVLEFTGREYMVRGRGYLRNAADLEMVALGAQGDGTPILVRDVGFVQLGPDIRRGAVDFNGLGDAAGGIVVVRYGESVYDVLAHVKQVIKETVQPSLPDGVELVVTYDRSTLIQLPYLDVTYSRWRSEGRMRTLENLEGAVMEGAVQRVRPKMMTVFAILLGLLPIMWSSGAGSDVMKRIAAPMVGGIVTSSILELLIYPAIYVLWKWWAEVRHPAAPIADRITGLP
jgi:Cu/Ag efflux pump CusA